MQMLMQQYTMAPIERCISRFRFTNFPSFLFLFFYHRFVLLPISLTKSVRRYFLPRSQRFVEQRRWRQQSFYPVNTDSDRAEWARTRSAIFDPSQERKKGADSRTFADHYTLTTPGSGKIESPLCATSTNSRGRKVSLGLALFSFLPFFLGILNRSPPVRGFPEGWCVHSRSNIHISTARVRVKIHLGDRLCSPNGI